MGESKKMKREENIISRILPFTSIVGGNNSLEVAVSYGNYWALGLKFIRELGKIYMFNRKFRLRLCILHVSFEKPGPTVHQDTKKKNWNMISKNVFVV